MEQRVTLLSLFSSREHQVEGYSSTPSSSSAPASLLNQETPLRLNASKVKQILEIAEKIIWKWNSDSSAYAKITSLWYESRQEARQYLRSVGNLQSVMHFLSAEEPSSPDLVRAQRLMQTAVKRLEKEFFQILSANGDYLDPESVSARSSTSTVEFDDDNNDNDKVREVGKSNHDLERVSSLAMDDLRSIAESMIGAGYVKECVKIYTVVRKSIVNEGLCRLGVDPLSSSKLLKMNWDLVEMKIKGWIHAFKIAVRTLFFGERILCDHVFASSQSIRESCFSDITLNGARLLFSFPEAISKRMKSPEKMFKMLDLYNAIAELWPEIESIFSYELLTSVRARAVTSLAKLVEAVRAMLVDFEAAIQKDWTKKPVQGSGLHPLTSYVMNFLSLLADYRHVLADITADFPTNASLPREIAECLDDDPVSLRFAWLILLLLAKLDGKVNLYRNVPLSYLFLTNNLQYVVGMVENSDLRFVLGDSWIQMHAERLRQYAASFERTSWIKVTEALTEISTATDGEKAKQALQVFNSAFMEAYGAQRAAIVIDSRLMEELKASITRKIVPAYHSLYGRLRVLLRGNGGDEGVIRFSPEDLENYIADVFHGTGSGNATSSVHLQVSWRRWTHCVFSVIQEEGAK